VRLVKLILLKICNSKLKIKKFGRLEKDALFLWRYKIPFVTSTYASWEKGMGERGKTPRGWGTGKHVYLYINIYYEI
jgi:hypothetical protein